MKATVRKPTEINIAFVQIVVPIRDDYDENDIPSDYPHRKGGTWNITVNADTGQILDWPANVPARHIYLKVVDQGTYQLLDENQRIISAIIEDYVPHGVVPGEYGDYLELEIDEHGKITNWPKSFDLDEFFPDD